MNKRQNGKEDTRRISSRFLSSWNGTFTVTPQKGSETPILFLSIKPPSRTLFSSLLTHFPPTKQCVNFSVLTTFSLLGTRTVARIDRVNPEYFVYFIAFIKPILG